MSHLDQTILNIFGQFKHITLHKKPSLILPEYLHQVAPSKSSRCGREDSVTNYWKILPFLTLSISFLPFWLIFQRILNRMHCKGNISADKSTFFPQKCSFQRPFFCNLSCGRAGQTISSHDGKFREAATQPLCTHGVYKTYINKV